MESKIIVIVRGGNVQSVHVSPDLVGAKIEVIDYDNLEAGKKLNKAEYENLLVCEGEIQNKQVVEIY